MFKKLILIAFILSLSLMIIPVQAQTTSSLEEGIKLFHQRSWTQSIASFKKALQENPYDSLALLYLLDSYYHRDNNFNEVSNEFEEQATNSPDDALAQVYLGMAYFARGLLNPTFLDESLQQFKQAVKLDSRIATAYTGMGLIYYQKRMIPRAKGYFLKALQLNPNDIIANEKLGDILVVDEKKYQEALEYFQKIAQMCPFYPDAFYWIGSTYDYLENYPEAVKALNQCLALDPYGVLKGYDAITLLGDIYLRQKMYPEAILAFQKALEINPKNPYAKYKLEKAKNPEKYEKKEKEAQEKLKNTQKQ